jgi:phospho-N-acetylmuramoyl-pentapeptide-transferase
MIIDIVKVFIPTTLSFILGVFVSGILTHYLYKYEMWKKKGGKLTMDGQATPVFDSLHKAKEVGTPRMGGVIVWLSVSLTTLIVFIISRILPTDITTKLDFFSRNQTWIPLFTLIVGGIVGLVDDYYEVMGSKNHIAGGLSLRKRLAVVGLLGVIFASWFYFRLDVNSIGLPHLNGITDVSLGWLFIPFFVLVVVGIYSGGVIDGLDGLAGGIFAIMFSAYAGIAFYQQGILAFLWFNIPPARYYMSETGTMGLTVTLAIVAFMTDSLGGGHGIFVLPIIAFPLIMTSLSNVIQILSKKLRKGKKVFLISPLHHHFEAKGWPA